ncbi:MAG TPA: hypothetical protein VK797_23130 [Tepidisphaeraceae bacterium]|jgi:hypothetical protein|nr:hypothetical protein [Tepidisphaeraceae bacterium]
MTFTPKQPVFIAEYGRGARPAHVLRSYQQEGRERVVVSFDDDQRCVPRDCFAESVFVSKAEAQKASQ